MIAVYNIYIYLSPSRMYKCLITLNVNIPVDSEDSTLCAVVSMNNTKHNGVLYTIVNNR